MIFCFVDSITAFVLRVAAFFFLRAEVASLLRAVSKKPSLLSANSQGADAQLLIRALVAGEDRRFFSHPGVDSRGLVRAVVAFFFARKIQGASTITQQLVRVLTSDYRYSFRRKLKEMCLACALDLVLPKTTQALLYLHIAYFGWGMNGLSRAMIRLNLVTPLTHRSAAMLVARLRYPQPRKPSSLYVEKLNRRAKYIEALISQ